MPRPSTGIVKVCPMCEITFCIRPSDEKLGRGRFCDRDCYNAHRAQTAHQKWVDLVDRTGECWIWKGHKDADGYGFIRVNGKTMRTHRYAWELCYGPIPKGKWVLHNCPVRHNPSCVNPYHLKLGNSTENVVDRQRQGTTDSRHGMIHPMSKLTDQDIATIRQRHQTGGVSTYALAREYHVSQSAIWQIVSRKTWTHLP